MKRLIFLHIGKTGGATLDEMLNKKKKRFELSGQITHIDPQEICQRLFESEIIVIHGFPYNIKSMIGEKLWNNLVEASYRLCIFRNPLDRIVSEWKFAYQKQSQFSLPFIPYIKSMNIDQLTSPVDSGNFFPGYFGQPETDQICLDDWLTFYSQTSPKHFSEAKQSLFNDENKSFTSIYYSSASLKNSEMSLGFNLSRNIQYSILSHHFGLDFISEPRPNKDILLTTELMTRSLSSLLTRDSDFRNFFEPIRSDGNPTYRNSIDFIRKHSKNVTKVSDDSQQLFHVSPQNKIKFFQENHIDYTIWQSTNIHQLKSLSDLTLF
ncbi:sulfotransferase family 2 domain-containing protein [Synechococcus sp. A15-24]|uniref:sulfotransferase family 2 domain-containing protein n=1 Tax=Synechococcus sp. A15-24 TaxID=1050635 RepID=UPI00164890D7|nr:sulfotransferase family 2 domain-containing protein [Synechococcus sp. A15-24]QNJ27816.1 hypothetical protein SynA1524_00094 [Synechococcus sp. A15-24]